MYFRFTISIGLALILSNSFAWAWPPTYGTEYNFSNGKIYRAFITRDEKAQLRPGQEEQDLAYAFADEVRAQCGAECTVTEHEGKFRAREFKVEFKNGYSFNISVDPSCIEIQTSPETLKQMHLNRETAETFIFGIARKLNLTGYGYNAHFNAGFASAFGDDAQAFLRFFTNFHNNPELASGILGQSFHNAPPLSHLKPEQRHAFLRLVDEVNRGKITSARELAHQIQLKVYTHTPVFGNGKHYQGIGLKLVNRGGTSDQPFEIRSTRQPENYNDQLLLTEFMEKRLAYEGERPGQAVYIDPPKQERYRPEQMTNRFRVYVAEMGADWEKFKNILPYYMRDLPEDAFVSGKVDWLKPGDIQNLLEHAPYIASSDWARERMTELLRSPEALKSGKLGELIQGIEKIALESQSPALRSELLWFLESRVPGYKKHRALLLKYQNQGGQECGKLFSRLR